MLTSKNLQRCAFSSSKDKSEQPSLTFLYATARLQPKLWDMSKVLISTWTTLGLHSVSAFHTATNALKLTSCTEGLQKHLIIESHTAHEASVPTRVHKFTAIRALKATWITHSPKAIKNTHSPKGVMPLWWSTESQPKRHYGSHWEPTESCTVCS